MKRFTIGLYAIPALLSIGVSLAPMEQSRVILSSVLACGVTVIIACLLLRFARQRGQGPWPMLAGCIACLAVTASVAILHWPLRAAYFVSRSFLNSLAQDVRTGQPFAGPTRAGLFTVVGAEVSRAGNVCLWVDLNPSGRTGFVQCAPDHVPLNLWSMISLDDRWQFIGED